MGYAKSAPTSFDEAVAVLKGRERCKIAGNTWLEKCGENMVLRYHSTDVVTFQPDGGVVLKSGGWRTVTTKERINWCLPGGFSLSQVKGVWYVMSRLGKNLNENKEHVFQDGIMVYRDGRVEGAGEDGAQRKAAKLTKAVKSYVTGYITALFAGKVEKPSNGDCWHCCMKTQDGRTLGEASGDNHMHHHIEESYYVPSIIVRAADMFGASFYTRTVLGDLLGYTQHFKDGNLGDMRDIAQRDLSSVLQRYVLRQVGMAA